MLACVLTFVLPCIVTNLFIIKPTICTSFTNLFGMKLYMFRTVLCPSSGIYSLYTQKWYMSCIYRVNKLLNL